MDVHLHADIPVIRIVSDKVVGLSVVLRAQAHVRPIAESIAWKDHAQQCVQMRVQISVIRVLTHVGGIVGLAHLSAPLAANQSVGLTAFLTVHRTAT